jgi:hypothetical protein
MACVGRPGAAAQPDARAPDYAALAAEVDRLERRLERLREAVDQTRFDPDELVFELAFDAGATVAFVREEIAFHPYEGLLRGLRGTLDESQVASLLARTAPAATVADLSGVRDRIGELFGPDALPQPEPVRWAETEPGRSAGETVEMLQARLAEAGVSLADRSLTAVLGDGLRPRRWARRWTARCRCRSRSSTSSARRWPPAWSAAIPWRYRRGRYSIRAETATPFVVRDVTLAPGDRHAIELD